MKKVLEAGSDIEIALLENRNTPASGLTLSPSEILLGRKTRTKLPISTNLLKSSQSEKVAEELKHIQNKYKVTYDRSARERTPFKPGQSVMLQERDKTWTPAQILNRHSCPRSYMLLNSKGKVYRRNSHFINTNFNSNKNFNKNFNSITNRNNFINNSNNSFREKQIFYKSVKVPQRQQILAPSHYITRSGRTTRPPERLGFNQP